MFVINNYIFKHVDQGEIERRISFIYRNQYFQKLTPHGFHFLVCIARSRKIVAIDIHRNET